MAHCGIKFQQGVHNKLANICENCAQFCQLTPQTPPPHNHLTKHTHMHAYICKWATCIGGNVKCFTCNMFVGQMPATRKLPQLRSDLFDCRTCLKQMFSLCLIGNIAISIEAYRKLINKSDKNMNENEKIIFLYQQVLGIIGWQRNDIKSYRNNKNKRVSSNKFQLNLEFMR